MANPDNEYAAAIFAGGGGPDLGKAAAGYLKEIRVQGLKSESAKESLNILWSMAEIGSLLSNIGWRVITGVYYMGPMGMASKAAFETSKNQGGRATPIGAIFSDFFPEDPLTAKGEVLEVKNLSQRQEMYFSRARAFFFMGGGGLGTLSEITGAMKDDSLREEVLKFGTHTEKDNLKPRPFFVIDPTGKMQELLTFIIEKYIGKEKALGDEIISGILKRMYIFGEDSFVPAGGQGKYPGLVHLSEDSKKAIEQILTAQSNEQTPKLPEVATLYGMITAI